MKNKIIYLLLFCTCLALPGQAQQFKTFEVGKKTFLLNGEPFIVKAAELHYTRIPTDLIGSIGSKCARH